MAFYIRKAFKTGPIRLNLSKGGLGLSGGVIGARVGVNSRGLYVHGGRHGLYYRKYAKQGKKGRRSGGAGTTRTSATRGRARNPGPTAPPVHSTVDLFRDTGVTYFSRTSELSRSTRKEVELPSPDLFLTPIKVALSASAILFLISLIASVGWLALIAILTASGVLGWIVRESLWKKQAENKLDEVVSKTESDESFPEESAVPEPELPDRWKEWLSLHLHAVIGELAMSREEIDTLTTLRALDEKVPADKQTTDRLRTSILDRILDEMLEDHLLSGEEEEAIRKLIDQLDLPEEEIASVMNRLEHYSRIRREIDRPLVEKNPGVPLVHGEKAFEVLDNVRLVNERVLNRFRRNNVQYRELGYEIDLEGRLILTDRRLLFAGRGSREYRLNRVLDVTADPEAGIVELTLSGRKSPVLITAPEPMVLAAQIEKVVESL